MPVKKKILWSAALGTIMALLIVTGAVYAASQAASVPVVTGEEIVSSVYESPYYTEDDMVRFSHTPGFYEEPFQLSLTLAKGVENSGDYQIRYTLDGNLPALSDAKNRIDSAIS